MFIAFPFGELLDAAATGTAYLPDRPEPPGFLLVAVFPFDEHDDLLDAAGICWSGRSRGCGRKRFHEGPTSGNIKRSSFPTS